MLDVLHFYFEEDQVTATQEMRYQRSDVRENMYKLLYGVDYAYKLEKPKENQGTPNFLEEEGDLSYDDEADDSDIKPFSPKNKGVKPFIPPSQPTGDGAQPFGSFVDAPLR